MKKNQPYVSAARKGQNLSSEKVKRFVPMYLLILPAVLITLIFSYFPLPGLLISFMDYDMFGGFAASKWVGLENIKTLFAMPNMIKSILNTLTISVLSIVIVFPIPIILAVLLNEIKNVAFKKTMQTITYLPHFLSWISVIGIAYSFYALNGSINDFLSSVFGMERVYFLAEKSFFVPNVILLTIWKETGWSSIIFLAAITGIDMQLYEAAQMDGAGKFKQFIHITLPGMMPTIVIMLILKLGQIFASNFDLIYGLQNVYIDYDVISTIVYKTGIQQGNFEISTALGFCQGIIALILTLAANKISDKLGSASIW